MTNAGKIIALSINDVKNIFRDRTLTIIFLMPVIIILLLRLVIPPLINKFPVLADYYTVIVALFCAATAVSPAFIVSFIMLDEKDENVLQVIRVMPLSPRVFVLYRILFIFLFGFIFSLLTIQFSALENFTLTAVVSVSVLFAMLAPTTALLIITFARNKIEGITLLKGINFIMMLPLLFFFVKSSWTVLLGVIPVYWTYQLFYAIVHSSSYGLYGLVSILLHAIFLAVLYKQFRKRVY